MEHGRINVGHEELAVSKSAVGGATSTRRGGLCACGIRDHDQLERLIAIPETGRNGVQPSLKPVSIAD